MKLVDALRRNMLGGTHHSLGVILFSYTIAYFLCTMVINYILNFPAWLTEEPNLVKEYFIKNGIRFFIMDWFIVAAYIYLGHAFGSYLGLKSNFEKLGAFVLMTSALSGFFYFLFMNVTSLRNTIFYRWFNKAGIKAIVYDAIFVGSIYVVFHKMLSKFKYHNLS